MARKKSNSRGSLLGRSSKSSQNKTGFYLVSIVAVVAVVALFLMVKGGSQTTSDTSEEVVVVDEEGNVVGMAFMNKMGSSGTGAPKSGSSSFSYNSLSTGIQAKESGLTAENGCDQGKQKCGYGSKAKCCDNCIKGTCINN